MTALFAAISGSRVDSENGIIRGVSVITSGVEAIGHGMRIDDTTLSQVKACADAFPGGVKVKMNHWSGVEAIVGILKNFSVDGKSLRADLQLLKTHEAFSKIIEMAQTIPDAFGLSISFSGKKETIEKVDFARCSELYSVDLVDSPAANPSGLFSTSEEIVQIYRGGIVRYRPLKVDTGERGMDAKTEEKSLLESFKGLFTKAEKGLISIETLSAAQAEVTTLKQQLEAKSGELSTAQATIKTLEAAAEKAKTDHQAALAAKESEVETRVAAKAAEITASQGVPIGKVKADKATDNSDSGNLTKQCLKANGKL